MLPQLTKMSAVFLLLAGTIAPAEAQTTIHRTQPGEEFQYGPDDAIRVIECYTRNAIDYCLVNWGIVSQGFWGIPLEVWRIDLDKLPRNFGAPRVVNPVVVPDDDVPVDPTPFKPTPEHAGPVGIPGCDPSAYTGFVPDSVPPSKGLFRAKITDQFTMQAYDNWYYGVEFYSFDVGTPFNNDITIDPAQGALLASFGAPPNVALYPVTTTFRVCEKESASTYAERFHDSTYLCFPKDGEWTCGVSESR